MVAQMSARDREQVGQLNGFIAQAARLRAAHAAESYFVATDVHDKVSWGARL